jgi:hypothetical protein
MKKLSKARQDSLKQELQEILEKLGYEVVYGKGMFKESTCVVRQDRKVVINVYTPLDLQLRFLIDLLHTLDLSKIYIRPVVRELLDEQAEIFPAV